MTKSHRHVPRRALLAGLGVAAGCAPLFAAVSCGGQPQDERPQDDVFPNGGPIVIRGTYAMTMDPATGDLESTDVLVRDGLIERIGRNLPASDATEIDGRNTITMPGFVDTHNHLWFTQMRGAFANTTDTAYFGVSERYGRLYQPADMETGTLLGALEALSAGITTTVDFCDNVRGPDYAERSIGALREAGIRARYVYGPNDDLPPGQTVDLDHLEQLANSWGDFDAGGRLTLGLGWRGPGASPESLAVARTELGAARRLGLPISVHASGVRSVAKLDRMVSGRFLGRDVQVIHATDATPQHLAALNDAGSSLALTPITEQRVGYGLTRLADYATAARMGLGIDGNALAGSADMFAVMRLFALTESGARRNETAVSPDHLLAAATSAAANAIGMADKVGSLTPGKQADLIVINTQALNLGRFGAGPPHALLAYSAQPANVDTVMVGGRVLKHGGRLLHADIPALLDRAASSMSGVAQR